MWKKSYSLRLTLFVVLGLMVSLLAHPAPVAASTTIAGGDVTGTWTASGSPYLIDGDITVPAGQTLTIEAGVEVIFQSWYKLTVNGTLLAEGTESAPILFTATPEVPDTWLGIRIIDATTISYLTHVIIERGGATGAAPENTGGGLYVRNSAPVITNATIRDNFAQQAGGGIALDNADAVIRDSLIINNQAGQGGSASGGGIYILDSNPELTGNVIRNNTVSVAGSFSTPTGRGGGIYARSSNPDLHYNVIADNTVNAQTNSHARGGGLYLYYGAPTLVNNTIAANSVTTTTSELLYREGHGIYIYHADVVIANSILWNDGPDEIFIDGTRELAIGYSDLRGGAPSIVNAEGATLTNLGGNIAQDPLFVDPANGDYRLQEGSPAIDAGTAYLEHNGTVIVDLAADQYNGNAPDMGALETGSGTINQPPVAVASTMPESGSAPLTVQFSSDGSSDPDGTIVGYAWDFGDGATSSEAHPSHTYADVGTYSATLTVTDDDGATHADVVTITVVDGTTIRGGDISGTWTASGSPYRIDGDITVPAGQTLTIETGVEVIFQSWYKLTVKGTLLAEGTESAPILFTATPEVPDTWLGIRIIDATTTSYLTHVIIERGGATGAAPDNTGGGLYVRNSAPVITNATIRDNFAQRAGGGIALDNADAVIRDSLIINNQAGQGGSASGGGIYILDSNPELTGNVIRGNSVRVAGSFSTPTGQGGGIYARSSNPDLRYNVIADNTVGAQTNSHARGGGLYLYYGAPTLVNNTIAANSVTTTTSELLYREGHGIYIYHADVVIANSILWNDGPDEIFIDGTRELAIGYSDLQGGAASIVNAEGATLTNLGGNINQDPLFVDPANGDYRLQEGSPAIDAGTAYLEHNGTVIVDLAADQYNGSAPDMGALESPYTGPTNQSPVAMASTMPESGSAPLTVQFSSDGSSDPDGTIVGYAWDFGDGATSSEAHPSHTYADVGTYSATLTVTDEQGATAGDTVTITVTEPAQTQMHVEDQTVTRVKYRKWEQGRDVVLITDQNNQPVGGATVTATFSGPNSGTVSGTTGADGTVVLETPRAHKAKELWCFKVIDVVKDGATYDPSANVVTVQCEAP